jgi:hypothetical protein
MKRSGRSVSTLLATGGAMVFFTSVASASPIVDFDITVTGGTAGVENFLFSQAGVAVGGGVYNYQDEGSPFPGGINGFGNEWSISNWDFNADGDLGGVGAATGAKINSVFTITNSLAEVIGNPAANHLHFSILITMPVVPTGAGTMWFGSSTITMNGNGSNPGELNAVGGPVWNAVVDGSDEAGLFLPAGNPILSVPGSGTDNANGTLAAGDLAGLVGVTPTEIGIRLDFDLTPGETVNFTGVFGLIPSPGALAMLAVAGLAGRGRRRR